MHRGAHHGFDAVAAAVPPYTLERAEAITGVPAAAIARAAELYAQVLADEVVPEGVLVTSVCPGYFRTDRVAELAAARARREGKAPEAILREQVSPPGSHGRAGGAGVGGRLLGLRARVVYYRRRSCGRWRAIAKHRLTSIFSFEEP